MTEVVHLPSFEELRAHVHQSLCRRDHLDPGQTPMHQSLITRQGRACGLFFQVHGPRLLRTYAVWASDENRILYYDALGERIAEHRLSEAPPLPNPIR